MKKLFLLILAVLFLAACGSKTTGSPYGSTVHPNGTGGYVLPSQFQVTVTPDPVNNPIVISDVLHGDKGLETVVIKNISTSSKDINGYTLLDPDTGESINIFNVTLDAGGTFNVYNGSTANDQTGGLTWLSSAILKKPGDEIFLLNRVGRLIAHFSYQP